MQKNNNVLTIVLVIAVIVLLALLVGKSKNTVTPADQGAAAGGGKNAVVYCEDSDLGANPYQRGATSTYSLASNGKKSVLSTYTDSCNGTSTLAEYYCNGNSSVGTSVSVASAGGTSCQDGAITGGKLSATVNYPISGVTANCSPFMDATIYPSGTSFLPFSNVTFMVDGAPVSGTMEYPNMFTPWYYRLSGYSFTPGTHTASVKACDLTGSCVTSSSNSFTCLSY